MPDLPDSDSVQKIGETAAMVQIWMSQDKARQVRLTILLGKLDNEFIDDGNMLVTLLVGHLFVVNIDLDHFGLADDDRCRVAGTHGPEDKEGPLTSANITSPEMENSLL